jgi:hypothetical protein
VLSRLHLGCYTAVRRLSITQSLFKGTVSVFHCGGGVPAVTPLPLFRACCSAIIYISVPLFARMPCWGVLRLLSSS